MTVELLATATGRTPPTAEPLPLARMIRHRRQGLPRMNRHVRMLITALLLAALAVAAVTLADNGKAEGTSLDRGDVLTITYEAAAQS